jgi:hypothetical protein
MSEAPLSDAGPVKSAPEGSAGPPWRGRTAFPWLGMLLSGVTVTGDAGDVTVPAGALVTVIRKMKDGLYVQVRGSGSGPLEQAVSVRVSEAQVDEVLGAVIERDLLGKRNISWGGNGTWKLPYVATQDFEVAESDTVVEKDAAVLVPGQVIEAGAEQWEVFRDGSPVLVPKAKVVLAVNEDGSLVRITQSRGRYAVNGVMRESHTIPGERRAVSAGERVAAGPVPGRTGYFLVSKQAVTGEVASGMLRRDTSLPPASSQVQLMCYEFGPYAAALAGLCPGFFEAAVTRTGAGAGEYWIHTLGGTLGSTKITPGELPGVQIQRGDFVVFYDDRDTSIHAAVATGDAQDVYSLWNRPEEFPVRVSIQSLCEPDDYWPVAYVKIAKLHWHS